MSSSVIPLLHILFLLRWRERVFGCYSGRADKIAVYKKQKYDNISENITVNCVYRFLCLSFCREAAMLNQLDKSDF